MKSFTLLEWEKLPCGDADGEIPHRFADDVAALAQTSSFAGRGGSGVIEYGRHSLRARDVVGILATKDCSLEILPKIEVPFGDTAVQNASIRKRLIHMLAVALDLKIEIGALTDLDWQRETVLEILIRIFCGKLSDAVRRGMPRRYIADEDDLPALRGKLDLTRQFTRNAVNPSRLACRFDVLSEDIALNQIMRAAVSHLSRLSRSVENQQRLRELAFVYADVTDVPPTSLRWGDVVIDRTNNRWRELLSMARLFLLNRYQATTGGRGKGTALLFGMNELFEEYIGRLVVRAFAGTEIKVSRQGGRRFCLTAEDTGDEVFLTKPDILIRRGAEVIHVIDTKWKRISSMIDDPKRGVSQSDVYQMMAYGQLYRSPRLTLLYPHHHGLEGSEGILTRHRVSGHEVFLETASIDVSIGTGILDRLRALLEHSTPSKREARVQL
jgi:5-methylcytosine-specific restriction enzyme subunit McrC